MQFIMMKKTLKKIRSPLSKLFGALIKLKHWIRLWWLGIRQDSQYRQYLALQLRRSLSKERMLSRQSRILEDRTRFLINRLIEVCTPSREASVLCIGCRNRSELKYFRDKGLSRVVGIDLFSESPDILVMDMHCMTFPDNYFDIIYSSHSLEHAYNVDKVVSEIIRVARPGTIVAIEVPVQYKTRGADLVDFGSLSNLHAAFEPHIAYVLWSAELPPRSTWNNRGTAAVRTIFTISKDV